MKIRQAPVTSLEPAELNPRKISTDELEKLKKAIAHFGFVEPLVLNSRTGRLIGGHQRLTAAMELGLAEVPVVDVDLPEDEAMALNLALNKIRGSWDEPALNRVLETLEAWLVDLTGFDPDDLEPAPESDEAELVQFGAAGHSWPAPDDHRVRCPKPPGKCQTCNSTKKVFE